MGQGLRLYISLCPQPPKPQQWAGHMVDTQWHVVGSTPALHLQLQGELALSGPRSVICTYGGGEGGLGLFLPWLSPLLLDHTPSPPTGLGSEIAG